MTVREDGTFAGIGQGILSQPRCVREQCVPPAEVLERLGLQRVRVAGVFRPHVTRRHGARVPPRDELPGQLHRHPPPQMDVNLVGRLPTTHHGPRPGCAAHEGARHVCEVLSAPMALSQPFVFLAPFFRPSFVLPAAWRLAPARHARKTSVDSSVTEPSVRAVRRARVVRPRGRARSASLVRSAIGVPRTTRRLLPGAGAGSLARLARDLTSARDERCKDVGELHARELSPAAIPTSRNVTRRGPRGPRLARRAVHRAHGRGAGGPR
jgi:hypothetical protein